MSEPTGLTELTLKDALDGLRARRFSAEEITRRTPARDRRPRGRLTPLCWRRRRRRSPWPGPPTPGSRPATPGRWKARRSGSRTCSAPKGVRSTAGSRILGDFIPPYEFDGDRQSLARRRGDAGQAQHGRVRHGLVERDQRVRPRGQSLAIAGVEPSPDARRIVRRLRRRGGRPPGSGRHRHRHRGLHPRSRRPSPAPSASSRRMAAVHDGASWRSRRRSTRPARSGAYRRGCGHFAAVDERP